MPFFIDPQHLAVDAVTAFCVSVLLAITINAEAQAFAATVLGDARSGDSRSRRFSFNCFLHLSVLGTICYLVGGFGWPRTVDLDTGKFKHPRTYTVLTRCTGPIANLALAGIAGSIVMIMKQLEWDPRVFLMVVGVNVTTAVYHLLPLPPLAAGSIIAELIPQGWQKNKWVFLQAGPFIVLALVFLERFTGRDILSPYFTPIITTVFNFIKS